MTCYIPYLIGPLREFPFISNALPTYYWSIIGSIGVGLGAWRGSEEVWGLGSGGSHDLGGHEVYYYIYILARAW